MPFLRRENGEQRGQCIELKAEEFLIGRAPDCHLVLDPQGVSRHHARIRRDGRRYFLEDLRSRNTTKLNDEVLTPRTTPAAEARRPDQHLRRRVQST